MIFTKQKIAFLIKELWIKFGDRYGTSIVHPQYIVSRLQKEAMLKAKQYAKGNLVDIGCGRMPYRRELEPLVTSYTGVDHPQVSKLYKSSKKPEVLADAKKLPFKDNSFDIALLLQVLEHVDYPDKAIKEAARILKPNGILIISIPFLYPLHDMPYDFGRYTETALKNFINRAALHIVQIKPQGRFFDFWLLSLNTFLAKRIKDIILSKPTILSISLLVIFIVVSLPVILLNNLLALIINLASFFLPKYPNYFPLDYLIIAKK